VNFKMLYEWMVVAVAGLIVEVEDRWCLWVLGACCRGGSGKSQSRRGAWWLSIYLRVGVTFCLM
jgi:hypothetical protein